MLRPRRIATLPLPCVLLTAAAIARGGEVPPGGKIPTEAADLYEAGQVWTVHLRFAAEQWAGIEPKGGTGSFDPSSFGMGMFLAPVVVRDGDKDEDGRLTAAEFRDLARRWFAAWDRDGDGVLDPPQLRAGLKGLVAPAGRGGEDQGPAPGLSLQGGKGKRNGLSALMGVEFAYVHADLEFEGRTFRDVAVRYKGNGTFLESRGSLKRSLKVDLNKYVRGQKLAGVATLNLHNNVADAGMMHEALAHRLYRDAGVPAPRTSHARVFLTVPGVHERKYVGLYTLIENIDKDFLADRDLGKDGGLFKPSTPDLFADLGPDWTAYEQAYDPKTELTGAQERRVIALARLVTPRGLPPS